MLAASGATQASFVLADAKHSIWGPWTGAARVSGARFALAGVTQASFVLAGAAFRDPGPGPNSSSNRNVAAEVLLPVAFQTSNFSCRDRSPQLTDDMLDLCPDAVTGPNVAENQRPLLSTPIHCNLLHNGIRKLLG